MQNGGQCSNGDDEHKSINFAVIITITQGLEKEKRYVLGYWKKEIKKLTEN